MKILYHGDNLDFLRGINTATVHLIATDPPFNKNRDFQASGMEFRDRWQWGRDVQQEWVDSIKADYPAVWQVIKAARDASGRDMATFLCWLGVRLIEMHRVLRPDGCIYLHIDHTAQAWVKALMDGIFGRHNFRNEIVWAYRTGGVSKRHWPRKHDSILFFVRSDLYTHRPMQERVYYTKPFFTSDMDEDGRPFADVYIRDVWDDVKPLINVSRERKGFPTQKPLALYERIIEASSSPGDIVLDPFAGSGTTLVAAERLGRQWIGIDIWDGVHEMARDRLPRHIDICYADTPPIRTDENPA